MLTEEKVDLLKKKHPDTLSEEVNIKIRSIVTDLISNLYAVCKNIQGKVVGVDAIIKALMLMKQDGNLCEL